MSSRYIETRLSSSIIKHQLIFRIALLLVSLLVINLNYPNGFFPPLALLGVIFWGLSMYEADILTSLFLGFTFGFGFFASMSWSLTIGMNTIIHFGLVKSHLFWFLFCAIQALPYIVFGLLHGLSRRLPKAWGPLQNAVILSVLQVVFLGMLPLTPVHALYKHPILFQTLDLGGLPLLLFVFNLFCWMTVEMLMRLWRRAGIKKYLIAQLALAACVTGYGGFRMVDLQSKEQRADDHQKIEITSIQPNLPVKKFGQALFVKPEDLNNDLTTVLKLTKDAIEAYPETDLLVWPELPIVLPCSRASDEQKKIQKMITQSGMQLIHICEQELPRHGGTTYHNTASHIRAVGKPGSMYSKKRLVPFGEYLPFEEEIPFLRKLFKNTRYYVPGNINTLFDVSDGKTIIPAICYELTFSNHIRDFALAGGNIILNMSNEAYFGRTAASVIALSLGVFRAVEYRMPLVRVTNSGNGCFVKPTGEIVANTLTLLFKKATISTSIFVPDEVSLYLSLGDSFLWVMSFAFCFFVIPIGLSFRTKT